MSSTARRSFLEGPDSKKNANVLADPNVSYRLLYWDVASVGATARDILAYGKAKWSNQLPQEVFITESIVIDQYLAKQFHLLGDDEWEELTIKGIYSNIHYLRERSFMNVTWTYPDKRKESLDKFLNSSLPNFIADHEFHLKANGSNGHYVGDKLSLADIHLANIIDHFSHLPSGEATTELFKKSELWKVKEVVEKHPDIAAWRATDECQMLAKGSIACYAQTAVSSAAE
ncbi:hypothetical protein B0O80DRAFT_424590 [Mortierella sp. GBAus27b]|nr:hypothetical protein B0O80DRAFT_424590 [Mortierella sp. GBAus27b]